MEIAFIFGISVLFFIWGIYQLLGYRKEKREVTKKYENMFKKENGRSSFISKLGDRFDQTPFAKKFKIKLLYANILILPSEFFAILLFYCFIIVIILMWLFSLKFKISIIIAAIITLVSYWLLFMVRRNKYIEKLNNQLSEVCRLLGNSTKAGMTINQGIEVVAAEVGFPARDEFKDLAHNLRLGVDFERALKEIEKRVPTKEFKLFIAALLIQKKSGGNLTKVLEEMAKTLEERKILRQTIKTATAEQRFISYILPAMPIFLILMLNSMMDGFIDLIFTIPGAILTTVFLIGMVISFILVRAVTNIKV